MPAKMATASPLPKEKSRSPGLGPILAGNLVLFRIAGKAADGNGQHAHADFPARITCPEVSCRIEDNSGR